MTVILEAQKEVITKRRHMKRNSSNSWQIERTNRKHTRSKKKNFREWQVTTRKIRKDVRQSDWTEGKRIEQAAPFRKATEKQRSIINQKNAAGFREEPKEQGGNVARRGSEALWLRKVSTIPFQLGLVRR